MSTGIPPPMTGTWGRLTVIGAHWPVVRVGSTPVCASFVAALPCPSVMTSAAITPPATSAHTTRTPASLVRPCHPAMIENHIAGDEVDWATMVHKMRVVAPLVLVIVALGVALAAVSAASGQPQRSSAQPKWLLFTADPGGLGVDQLFRITL